MQKWLANQPWLNWSPSKRKLGKTAPVSGLSSVLRTLTKYPQVNKRAFTNAIAFVAGALLIAACTRSASVGDLFIAPTLVGGSAPIILETFTALPASPTPDCENHLVFLRDITVPDGTRFSPGAPIEKSWEIRNDGTCAWIRGYFVQLEDGPAMGAIDRQALPEALPGEVVVLTVQFTAPAATGSHRSSWRAHDFAGNPFGVLFFIDIVVE
jgi:hypothetical protein